jgi:Flp pilus assembly protein TadG
MQHTHMEMLFPQRLKAKSLGTVRRLVLNWIIDVRATAALEFALVLPILLTFVLGTVETTDALQANRRVSAVTVAAADLVARVKAIDDGGIADVIAASRSMLQPYTSVGYRITITSIAADGSGDAIVHWTDTNTGESPHVPGQEYAGTLPTGILAPNESIVMTEVEYDYSGPVTSYLISGYTITEVYFSRPRLSRTVLRCDDLSSETPVCI